MSNIPPEDEERIIKEASDSLSEYEVRNDKGKIVKHRINMKILLEEVIEEYLEDQRQKKLNIEHCPKK